jgi:hypothetical protein
MMTSAQLRPQNAAPPSPRLFLAWLERASPGEALVYHRGLLAHDRSKACDLSEAERRSLAGIADAVFQAAEQGQVHLVQRRNGPGSFRYLAIRAAATRATRVTRHAA